MTKFKNRVLFVIFGLYIVGIVVMIVGIITGIFSGSFIGFLMSVFGSIVLSIILFALAQIINNQEDLFDQLKEQELTISRIVPKNKKVNKCSNCKSEYDIKMNSCPYCGSNNG